MAPQGYGVHPQQQQGYGGQSQQQMPPQNQQRPGSSYQRKAGGGGFVAGSTMGPAGTVDFASLANSSGGMWSDPDFRPDNSSLWIDERQPGGGCIDVILSMNIQWKRAHELAQANTGTAGLFKDDLEDESGQGGAEANDIIQGSLGDCYLMSSLAILCTSKGLGLVDKLFVSKDHFDKGLVGLRFFKEGQWVDVAIDTYLPCNMDYRAPMPVFARNKDPTEFWMSLLEKAYAKVHGSYESLDAGFMNESLVDLTGAAPGSIKILDLFASCMEGGRPNKDKALHLLDNRTFGELLQGASSDNGGSEEPLGNGLHSGHAYSINQVKKTSTGECLVQLRNPWGGHEWSGAWNDKDPRWTESLKREMGQRDVDDGMFWMSVDDFSKAFTDITFCDLVPPEFTVLRAESEWTAKTGGGCANYKTWKLNPQLLMRVHKKSHITISLNQPDSRLQFQTGELGKADFDSLYGCSSGYEDDIGFAVFQGSERKAAYSTRSQVASAQYSAVRTVSTCIAECEPGDYIIVPTTFEPCKMKFRMRFWSSNPIDLIDTKGGSEWQIFDASLDSLSAQDAPMPTPSVVVPEERAPPPLPGVAANATQNVIVKHTREQARFSGSLSSDLEAVGKANWKVGDVIPEKWAHGQDFTMGPSSTFNPGEMCAVMRPDRSVRFAKISRDNGNSTYDLCTGCTTAGLMHKTGVPAQFICKLPHNGPFPAALAHQVGVLFDLIDADGSGTLDFHFDGQLRGELASDLGKRFLSECQVDPDDMQVTYEAMKQLDRNGDGVVDREEFVDWMCDRMIMLATHMPGK